MAEGSGLSELVPVGRAQAHLGALRDAGGSSRAIAAAAGVSRRTVSDVMAGRRARIRDDVSGRLLAVTFEQAGPAANPARLVAAAPTLARLRQLGELGCSRAWIAEQLGMARPPMGPRYVTAATEAAAAELVERVERERGGTR